MKARDLHNIPDVQATPDSRKLAIDQVGIKAIRHPVRIMERSGGVQHTIALFNMYVGLPHHFKGTHMSRFVEVLNEYRGEVTMRTLPALLGALQRQLRAESAHVEVEFPYFLERVAPESGARALMDYECSFVAEASDERDDFVLGVRVPVTSLCPCSKAISDYGAHNQRGYLTIEIRTVRAEDGRPELIWIEDLIELAEQSASAPVYPLVKRVDERRLTMQAYDNPVFVEDMVRNVATHLANDRRVAWFRVYAKNDESIHNHSVFAQIERNRAGARQAANTAVVEVSAGKP